MNKTTTMEIGRLLLMLLLAGLSPSWVFPFGCDFLCVISV